MKVFLGGTVNNSKWRNYVIPRLKVEYYNPVVEEWTAEVQQREIYEREICHFCLYVLTPKMTGYYSIAEVTDDSYRKTDKTIFCYLPEDEGETFSDEQLTQMHRLGHLVQANGAVWKQTLDEVIDFLNSANELANDNLLQQTDQINNCFISYGRRHSLAFARKLYKNLTDRGYQAWFDMNDIPLGVDFQDQIDDGIRKADNFIYIMSPHSINSVYCYKELVLALKYNKRIIPILHVEPQDNATWDKIDPEAGRRNWIYMRQNHDTALELSAKTFELQEKILQIPENQWNFTDNFETAFNNLTALLDSHRAYVRTHTVLLDKTLDWIKDGRNTEKLLVGKERQEAEAFLQRSHQVFKNPTGHLINPPCQPTNQMAEFAMESKKNGNNKQCDVFICHAADDKKNVKKITTALAKHGFSAWIHDTDIEKGTAYEDAIVQGVEKSSNLLFFVSEKALKSAYCQKEYAHALQLNKRIIPVFLQPEFDLHTETTAQYKGFEGLHQLQYIHFSNLTDHIKIEIHDHTDVKADVEARREKTPFEISTDELVHALETEHAYYEEHRVFLVQALRWKNQNKKPSFLLRGFNLDNAKTWLRLHEKREYHRPTPIHTEFINASEAARGQLGTDVFISYSRKDGDFARKLNQKLQIAGKTTWFDQESISKGVDFEREIFKGIDGCDNFVIILSPDAVKSEYCDREVAYAVSQNKRMLTLLWRNTETSDMPEALRLINWIDFKNHEFGTAFQELVNELETDREHAHAHTVWQQRAIEWDTNSRCTDFLLNNTACANAEEWLKLSGVKSYTNATMEFDAKIKKSPSPTPLQAEYIAQSRKIIDQAAAEELKKRKRLLRISVVAGFAAVVAMVALIFSAFLYTDVQNAKTAAEKNFTEAVMYQRQGKFKDAKSFMDQREFHAAYGKYAELLNLYRKYPQIQADTNAVIKRMDYCQKLLVTDSIFENYITKADSLINFTDNPVKLKNSFLMYQKADSLQYEYGKPQLEKYNIKLQQVITTQKETATTLIEAGGMGKIIARDILDFLQAAIPNDADVHKLQKQLN